MQGLGPKGPLCSLFLPRDSPPGHPTGAHAGTATLQVPWNQLCCAGQNIVQRCSKEVGMPNELINVGTALGDLRLRGAQYMQIRVVIITHNYRVSAGEIIQK